MKVIPLITIAVGLVAMKLYSQNQPSAGQFFAGDPPDVVVLRDLLTSQTDARAKLTYGVYFVQIDTNYQTRVVKELKDFLPRVEMGTNNAAFTSGGLIDKVNQKPAKLFWVEKENISEKSATIAAGYYIGPEGAVTYEYTLKFNGGMWVIISRKEVLVT
jgi:hypothetical protein